MKMTYSGFVKIDGQNCVSVLFERGSDMAEGLLPDGVIRSSNGFSEDELKQLSDYLVLNCDAIMEEAGKISGFINVFSDKK